MIMYLSLNCMHLLFEYLYHAHLVLFYYNQQMHNYFHKSIYHIVSFYTVYLYRLYKETLL